MNEFHGQPPAVKYTRANHFQILFRIEGIADVTAYERGHVTTGKKVHVPDSHKPA